MKASSQTHSGHRNRLRRRRTLTGIASFEGHEVLELLLYTVIPQRDVNPLAHMLIQRFGSVGAVLSANEAELAQVPGMGAYSASWFVAVNAMVGRYAQLKLSDRPKLVNISSIKKYCAQLFTRDEHDDCEQAWLFSMNLAGHLLGVSRLCTGAWTTDTTIRDIAEPALRNQAQSALIVLQRSAGRMSISDEDVLWLKEVAGQFLKLKIWLLDCVLVHETNIISMRLEGIYEIRETGIMGVNEDAGRLYERWNQ